MTVETRIKTPEFKPVTTEDIAKIDDILEHSGFQRLGETLVNWGGRKHEVVIKGDYEFIVKMELEGESGIRIVLVSFSANDLFSAGNIAFGNIGISWGTEAKERPTFELSGYTDWHETETSEGKIFDRLGIVRACLRMNLHDQSILLLQDGRVLHYRI